MIRWYVAGCLLLLRKHAPGETILPGGFSGAVCVCSYFNTYYWHHDDIRYMYAPYHVCMMMIINVDMNENTTLIYMHSYCAFATIYYTSWLGS